MLRMQLGGGGGLGGLGVTPCFLASWGFSFGRSLGLSFLGAMVFFSLLLFLFFYVIVGSGVLSHGAVFGFFFFSFFHFSLWTLRHF